ncbi:tail fiber domain-containing protein [Xanthobacter versatilis]|uniref:tail fiber domain-containing protein n=1 Tax=Xanthobacter autotrophicus (strain ATCC BAA-1158 / Py2) TaxID=78245 RepID=UPI003729282F
MGGSSSQTQATTTQPWAPAIGPLNNVLGKVNSLTGTTGVTADQSSAFDAIKGNAGALQTSAQNYSGLLGNLYGGGGYGSTSGMLKDTFDNVSGALSPYTSADYADPTKNPIYQRMADLAGNQAQNSVNGMFAAAGRSMSGAHAGALGKGITDAMTGVYANGQGQLANQQLQGLGLLNTAGQGTSSALEGIQGQRNAAGTTAAQLNQMLPGILNQPYTNAINADSAQWNLPVQQLGMLSNLLVPIAGLGGTSNSTTTTKSDPLSNIIGGALGLGSLFSAPAGGTSAMAGLMALSDRRAKRDISRIGELYDGLPVYRFRYHGCPKWHVGLMADEVEAFAPEAVAEVEGFKVVDYGRATERAMEAA